MADDSLSHTHHSPFPARVCGLSLWPSRIQGPFTPTLVLCNHLGSSLTQTPTEWGEVLPGLSCPIVVQSNLTGPAS